MNDEQQADPGPGGTTPPHAYDAFISYSHAVDGSLAPALQRGLHRLARPWNRPRALRVFYDQSSLAVTEDLWGSIEKALRESAHFILMASRESAASEWVGREVAFWRREREPGTFLIVLTGGAIHWDDSTGDFDWDRTNALPQALRGWFAAEPLWTDLSWAHTEAQLSLQNARFRSAVGSLAAPLHGVPKDELDSEDVRQRRTTIRMLSAGVVVLVLALIATLITGYQAEQQRKEAVSQRQEARRQREEAERQRKAAEEQRGLASLRALLAEAETLRDSDPRKALQLGLAAEALRPTDETRGGLVTTLMRTRYRGTTALGRLDTLGDTALSRDARLLAAPDEEETLQLWDLTRADRDSPVARLGATTVDTGQVEFSRDGKLLAVAESKHGVRMWDVSTPSRPRERAALPGPAEVTGVAFAPDGHSLVTVGEEDKNGRLTVWDIRDPDRPRDRVSRTGLEDATDAVLSPDGRTLVTTSGTVRASEEPVDKDSITHRSGLTVWDFRNPQLPARLGRIDNWDAGPVFSPDSGTFAVGHRGSATLWQNSPGRAPRHLATLNGARSSVNALAFSGDGATLASGHEDGRVVLWDTAKPSEPKQKAQLEGHTDWVEEIAFLPRRDQLVTLDLDGAVMRWRLSATVPSRLAELPPAGYAVKATALSPDGRTVAMGGVDEQVTLWDITDRRKPVRLAILKGHSKAVTTVGFSHDSGMLASGGDDGRILLWDVTDRRHPYRTATLKRPTSVGSLAFAPRGRTLAATGNKFLFSDWGDGWTLVWDAGHDPPKPRGRLDGGNLSTTLSYGPDSTLVMSGTATSLIGASDTHQVKGGGGVLSRDGTMLATSGSVLEGSDESVVLWDARSKTHPRKLAAFQGADSVRQLTFGFHPEGRLLAVGTEETAAVWDIGQPSRAVRALTLPSDTEVVDAFHFTRDGRTMVAGAGDGAEVWDLGVLPAVAADPHGMACEITGSGLTREQWKHYAPGIPYEQTCLEK
ncbi:TIR domain-containing protein [Streptomyces sp. 8N616]|uniref:TIR domain-containing protein n=1 Tax=Streptomyces sp. 8N616 TaxID=3457414 RepID=UPI003FD69126